MPIGLIVPDGIDFENDANGDNSPPLGRELEVADLLHLIKQHGIQNVVRLIADVQYSAAHYIPIVSASRTFCRSRNS